MDKISVFGLGKLGLPLAVAFAQRGFSVIGVDIDQKRLDILQAGIAPFYEPGLDALLASSDLAVTSDAQDAVMNSDISIIMVPTPTDRTGMFSLEHVISVCMEIGNALRNKSEYHLVVISSTIMPGSCENEISNVL
ncbi:GDP-mannose dehydrogenase, partial [Patescibacteria group bacterium]|nr:GDP-mannose dehydrogenase [Patescibacteria group bacterium]